MLIVAASLLFTNVFFLLPALQLKGDGVTPWLSLIADAAADARQVLCKHAGRVAGLILFVLGLPICYALLVEPSQFRLEGRLSLSKLWQACRFGIFGIGLGCSCAVAMLGLAGLVDQPEFGSLVTLSCTCFVLSAAAGPTNRHRVIAFLSRLTTNTDKSQAAGIAALVGQRGIVRTMKLARRLFCGLPFGELAQWHFATNEDTGLHEKVASLKLGECDAFLSHSWSALHMLRIYTSPPLMCAWVRVSQAR
jgi:hypothetical protein